MKMVSNVLQVFAAIALLYGALWYCTATERENNRHINDAIYPAFREIENRCLAEPFPHQTVRCQRVLALKELCWRTSNDDDMCYAKEYYAELSYLGFDLPPYYEPGYTPK